MLFYGLLEIWSCKSIIPTAIHSKLKYNYTFTILIEPAVSRVLQMSAVIQCFQTDILSATLYVKKYE